MSLVPRRPWVALAGAALFAATAALVSAGAFTRLDQYAVDHLMPWWRLENHPFVTIAALTLPGLNGSVARVVVDLWTYPGALVPSALLLLASAWRLRARGRLDAAITWCVLWLAGNAVELAGKLWLQRPDLERHGMHVYGFDQSLPSGHTIRSLLVAGAIACAWHWGRLALVWAAGVPFALVVLGHHTPTDVAAGVFVVLFLAAWAPTRSTSRPG